MINKNTPLKGRFEMTDDEVMLCRVCAWEQSSAPWGKDGDLPSFQICSCCGVEFGYEDFTLDSLKKYRESWLSEGAVWFDPKERPADWNLEKQLEKVPASFR